MSAPEIKIHFPLHWFSESEEKRSRVALIILNNKMAGLDSVIRKYWKHFSVVACADGGSNLLYDNFDCRTEGYIPDVICGDMDSARDDVLEFFHSKGCSIERRPLQDTTDFTKTLLHLLDLRESGKCQFSMIYVFNGIGGRFDHTIANINTLYSHFTADVAVYLVSEDTLLFPLEPGQHTIYTNSDFVEGHCGLIPLGRSCSTCTTSGLKWNMDEREMRFGDLVSTSNLIEGKQITVSTSDTVLWTMSHTLIKSLQ